MSNPPKRAQRRALIVDDDASFAAAVARYFSAHGYDTKVSDTAFGVSKLAMGFGPDIIILDVMMPALDGGQLTQLLRKSKHTKSQCILLASNMPEPQLAELAQRAGADGHLSKTKGMRKLLEAANHLLCLRSTQEAAQLAESALNHS